MAIALTVFGYAAYRLYGIMQDYREADRQYADVREHYTSPSGNTATQEDKPVLSPKYEDAEAPLVPDWDGLKAANQDIVGWIYVDARPDISYPICYRKDDDDYYLHRSYTGEYLYAGAIFLEGYNNPDFSDPVSILYGHNMKNGSMFAQLKDLIDQDTYDANPYFWILTPGGNYRYKIFSVFQTDPESDVYTLISKNGEELLHYGETMKAKSAVSNDTDLYEDDRYVVLSTCVSDHVHRTVVIGRCVSSTQPVKTTDDPAAWTTETGDVYVDESGAAEEETVPVSGQVTDPFGIEGF